MIYGSLGGDKVYVSNFRLRFFLVFLAGLLAFASIIYWRSQLYVSQEYVEFPQHKKTLRAPAGKSTERLEKELKQ